MKDYAILASVLDMKPHPDQATHNPGTWAVQFRVSHAGKARTFWRWHIVRRFNKNGALIEPDDQPPSVDEILARFWDDTFGDLHGFDFQSVEDAA